VSPSAPPDGLIARTYADRETGYTDAGRAYMRDCLLKGMRGEPLPDPRKDQAVGKVDGALIRQKAHSLLPEIDRIRAGEEPLLAAPPPAPKQTDLPF
jgi:hypothetical protein